MSIHRLNSPLQSENGSEKDYMQHAICYFMLFYEQALAMIADIRTAFNELLDEVPWIDESTRQVAREKVIAQCVVMTAQYSIMILTTF
jgi:Peptidase family M13